MPPAAVSISARSSPLPISFFVHPSARGGRSEDEAGLVLVGLDAADKVLRRRLKRLCQRRHRRPELLRNGRPSLRERTSVSAPTPSLRQGP